jgi:hypothetical protein
LLNLSKLITKISSPKNLVLNKDSHLLSMINETGSANAKKLINMALGKNENEEVNLDVEKKIVTNIIEKVSFDEFDDNILN